MNELNEKIILDSLDNEKLPSWGLKAIKAPEVWGKTMGEDVTITLVDTGIDMKHPDLKDRIISKFNPIYSNTDVTDEFGHGTHVAGLLVGKYTGVAPKSNLHVVKALNENGLGRIVDIMDGITYAMNIRSDILCLSLGTKYDIPLILKQRIVDVWESGITIVCAVGNNGNGETYYPARMLQTIGVGGLDENLIETRFSNSGYDVLAPSVRILSTYKDSNYAFLTGTSMASPLVAGAIALIISYYRKQGKNLKPYEIKEMLKGSNLDLNQLIT